ncbi:MAG: 3-phosphoshikimate 1-carboxyvinyltransferase [Deltaproteobacteria bacterium]|nr:3-phosphoshikimate 1-carboxyvinyltransferase [Deltaproteobacteria bacterium]
MRVPPSKSITHRALVCAGLAAGESILYDPLACGDTEATVNALKSLGVSIRKENEGWRVRGGQWQKPLHPLDCNESGTTWRFLTAITQALKIPCTITGKPSLLRRPLDSPSTSQFLSGQLLASPLAKRETWIELPAPPISRPYVELTLSVQKAFGVAVDVFENFSKFRVRPQSYRPADFSIEGDWSAAAVLLAAGVLKNGVVLEGLNRESLQGDRAIFSILKEMGAEIFWEGDKLTANPSRLRAVNWNLDQTPDLYPLVAVLNTLAEGKSRLTGIERLRFKESDRLAAMEKITTGGNFVDSRDHRIIMAAAVLGKALGVEMKFAHPECVAKSWPGFWDTLQSL